MALKDGQIPQNKTTTLNHYKTNKSLAHLL